MKLQEILQNLSYSSTGNGLNSDISDIVYDSRKAEVGTVFVCMTGAETDGHKYARSAYDKGCRAFVIEKGCEAAANLPTAEDGISEEDIPFVAVTGNTRAALAIMSDNFFCHPSKEVKVIGITGTKGKTSTTYILQTMLNSIGYETGLIGTAGASWKDKRVKTVNTTPESYEIQKLLRMMADDGVKACAIEVSSLGVKWHRVDALNFFCGVFANISPDHIGGHEHKTYEEYYSFKKLFFSSCRTAAACADDPASEDMLWAVPGRTIFYGKADNAEFRAENETPVRYDDFLGIKFDLICGNENHGTFEISLPGEFSVENALCALSICSLLGFEPEEFRSAMRQVSIPGRNQIVYMSDEFGIIIDYAHNGLSLGSLVDTMRAYGPDRIIALYGSVGDRAQLRRQELGTISGQSVDFTVITEDDPGYEDPQKICDEIAGYCEAAGGRGKYIEIPDREEAVAYAVSILKKGDILLCCGKGHEKYMKVNGGKVPFDEEACIKEGLRKRGVNI